MNSDLNLLINIFQKMEEHGFDIAEPLKWGFFFFDKEKDSLLDIINELQGADYSIENLGLDDNGYWKLALSKTEILDPENLHQRNLAFNELAELCGAELYDGWDVERVGVL